MCRLSHNYLCINLHVTPKRSRITTMIKPVLKYRLTGPAFTGNSLVGAINYPENQKLSREGHCCMPSHLYIIIQVQKLSAKPRSKKKEKKGATFVHFSINQSNYINYSANIPGVARLNGAAVRSVFKCKSLKLFREKVCFETSSKGGKRGDRVDRQYKVVPKRRGARAEGPCTSVGPDLSVFSDWSQWAWWKRSGNHGANVNSFFFLKSLVGQQADLEMDQWREHSSGTLRVNGGDFVTTRARRFKIRWSLVRSVSVILDKIELQ